LRCERWQIYQQNFPNQTNLAKIWEITRKRAQNIPLQYLLGYAWFYGYQFIVGKGVLIPRPETEILVEKVLREKNRMKVLEIGTGSGAIAIILKKKHPQWQLTASDNSAAALQFAEQNIKLHQIELQLVKSDLFTKINGKFDIIVSNPPYISSKDYKKLPAEIKLHEPAQALIAGERGLEFYKKILKNAKEHLTKNGVIYFEIGEEQADDITRLACDYRKVEIYKDLNGRDRVVRIER
jgi:release factor glutamine methyltransferase